MMASRVESSNSGTRLPLINEGQGLVSPPPTSRSPTIKEQASQWAQDIRLSIEESLANNEDVDETAIYLLRQELLTLVIAALQKDNRPAWQMLREAVLLIQPYAYLLSMGQQLTHYLERLHSHLEMHKERLFDVQVQEALQSTFPKEMAQIQGVNVKPKKDYTYAFPKPSRSGSLPSRNWPAPTLFLPDGRNPYQLNIEDEAPMKPKGLTFGDLRMSLPNVALEMATREAIWSACMGNTAQALNIDLLEEVEETSPPPSTRHSSTVTPRSERSEVEPEEGPVTQRESLGPLDGRQAVEYFTKCLHTGKIKFMYFNLAPSRHYQPYSIISVPKNKVDKEHYVFSTFGVLHVYADQPSENLTLAEWQREAVLFRAVSIIPFFKYFLLRKMFQKWHDKVRFAEFSQTRRQVASKLLEAIPSYGAALLQVSQLSQELMKLKIFPLENSKCYQLPEFENSVYYLNMQADKVLDRFFRYIQVIVETTAEELVRKVQHCEEQARHKPVFTKDSLHLQRVKREQREDNLRQANDELNCLKKFIRLVDHMVLSRLLMLARASIEDFVSDIMVTKKGSKREALFKTNMVFNSKDQLLISPTREKFMRVMTRIVDDLPKLVISAAEAMDDDGSQIPLQDNPAGAASLPTTAKFSSNMSRRASSLSRIRHVSRRTVSTALPSPPQSTGTAADRKFLAAREASTEAARILPSPEMLKAEIPSKDDDDLGQATPRMIATRRGNDEDDEPSLSNYKALSKHNFEEKLKNDIAYNAAISKKRRLLQDAVDEVTDFCEKNSWLVDIHKFCKAWNETSVLQWRGAVAYTIEQKLNELRQWIDRVRNFDKTYTTRKGLFCVDCSGIHDLLIPRLNTILKELCTFIADESTSLAKNFCKEISAALENLKNQATSINGFALYARHIAVYKENRAHHQQQVEYIKSLFEVIRMSYRQLTLEEEKLDENVWHLWEAFLFQMQLATDFINTQTPVLSEDLQDQYQSEEEASKESIIAAQASVNPAEFMRLEQRAHELFQETSSGKFLDPKENPAVILHEMTQIRDEFYAIRRELEQASKWKEAITGTPYSLDFLQQMGVQMDIRQELWKYIEVSTHAINDWKKQAFRKMDMRQALDKVTEWQAAAGQIKSHLPQADEVLKLWYKKLVDFKQELPYLYKMSNTALKVRHWKAIFVGFGEQYDPSYDFTVEELMSFQLSEHSHVILSVYRAAIAESTIDQELSRLEKAWEDKEFKLAKHIPDSVYKEENHKASKAGAKKLKHMEVMESARTNRSKAKSLDAGGDDLYVLIEIEELRYMLEDSLVSLQRMLSSPYLADHKTEAIRWSEDLLQIQDIITLWHTAQTNWRFLLKIFEEPDMYRKYEALGSRFETVHEEFREFMLVILADPKVTSILNKGRNAKGYRTLQGERLRDMLHSLIEVEEEIFKDLSEIFQQARTDFPRLYFLSDEELVQMLSVSRNPTALVPFVQKCFSGIEDVSFALPGDSGSMGTSLDLALNVHKLEATTLHSSLGETLPLYTPLPANPQTMVWLAQLEHHMKTTISTALEACVQARLDEACSQPVQILDELAALEQKTQEKAGQALASEIKATYGHWLLQFPAQCVLVAEAILWERAVYKALIHSDMEELKALSSAISSRIDQYASVLRDNVRRIQIVSVDQSRARLHCLLGCLIGQSSYHRDVIKTLTEGGCISERSFDWLRVLKYHMEIKTILQAHVTSGSGAVKADQHPASEGGPREHTDEKFDLQHSRTTVGMGYHFSNCMISQLTGTYAYDCEYLGPVPRLIFTPLTERAYFSLTVALQNFQAGALVGPAGTGKTQTVHDLAKAMGRHLVSVNCSAEWTMPVLARILTGAVQSGCWALLDDINRLPYGLCSVLGQQLEGISHAMQVLHSTNDNQYGRRGQPSLDKRITKSGKHIRRNSLTTLHSLPAHASRAPSVERQATVPHGFNEAGLSTYFEDTWIDERNRRHSIEKELNIQESEHYKSSPPPPLFNEFVTQHRRQKKTYTELSAGHKDYVSSYLGNILLDGRLVPANANFGCFLTMTTTDGRYSDIPQNLRLAMRPCALVVPDVSVIIEMIMFTAGFAQHNIWAGKLGIFFKMLKLQLPREPQYELGLKTVLFVLAVARKKLQEQLQLDQRLEERKADKPSPGPSLWPRKPAAAAATKKPTTRTSIDDISPEESSILKALSAVLQPKMQNAADAAVLKSVLRDVFPKSSRPKSATMGYRKELVDQVEEQLRHENLLVTPTLVEKILLLYSALHSKQGVILLGPAGSGKTTCYQILAKALTALFFGRPEDVKEEELTSERSLSFMYTQKLKIAREAEVRGEAKAQSSKWKGAANTMMAKWKEMRDKVLKDSTERDSAKEQPKKWKKATSKGSLMSKIVKNFQSISEDETKAREALADEISYPKVAVEVVMPNVHTTEELYGHFQDGIWEEGLLAKILHQSHDQVQAADWCSKNLDEKRSKGLMAPPSVIHKWLVLDGALSPSWVESLHTVVDDTKMLSVASGGHVKLNPATSLVFELTDLSHASPSIISQCPLVCVDTATVGWRSLWETWGQMARQRWVINAACWQVLSLLANKMFPATLKFLQSDCQSVFEYGVSATQKASSQVSDGMAEVSSFLRLLSALLDRYLLREDMERSFSALMNTDTASNHPKTPKTPGAESGQRSSMTYTSSRLEDFIPHYMTTVRTLFAFAYGWGFGGSLHDSCQQKFAQFAQETLSGASPPINLLDGATIFDLCLDTKHGTFMRWSEKTPERARGPPHYVVVPEVDRYNYLVDLLLGNHMPVLLMGEPGVGKTSLVEYMVQCRRPYTHIMISPGTQTASLHDTISKHVAFDLEMKQKAATFAGKIGGTKPIGNHLFFLDDLSAAPFANHGDAKPVHEFLRQILCHRGAFDKKRKTFMPITDVDFVATATNPGAPGSGNGYISHPLCGRLRRHFTILNMFAPDESMIHSVYGHTIQTWLEEFPSSAVEHHYELGKALVQGTLDIYNALREKFKPTPSTPHYVFSLHDLSKVTEGMLLMSSRSKFKVATKSKKVIKKTRSLEKKISLPEQFPNEASYLERPRSQSCEPGMRGATTPGSEVNSGEPLPGMRIIARLWCHEVTRVFGDRLCSTDDQRWFEALVRDTLEQQLCTGTEEPMEKMSTILEDTQSHMGIAGPNNSPALSLPTTPGFGLENQQQSRGTVTSLGSSTPGDDLDPQGVSEVEAVLPAPSGEEPGQQEEGMADETALMVPKPPTGPKPQSPGKPRAKSSAMSSKKRSPTKTARSTPHTATTKSSSADPDDDDDESESEEESSSEEEESSDSDTSEYSASAPTDRDSSLSSKLERTSSTNVSGSDSQIGGKIAPSLKRTQSKGSRRGVSFKVGLIADKVTERYYGPLLHMDQICGPAETLTEVMFSKFIMSTHAEEHGLKAERGYQESRLAQFIVALESCLASYNRATGASLDLVFFKDAVQHMARLTRVMATVHGHALLLGTDYCTGRSTMVRLAAHLASCRVYTAKQQATDEASRMAAHEAMKECSKMAAINGRPTVLLMKDDLGPKVMEDVCTFIKEGQCAGLYTASEVEQLATQMTPGQVKTTRLDKLEAVFNKFLTRVKQNLHVVVCMRFRDENVSLGVPTLASQLARYPTLLHRCCSVDVYQPWPHEAYITVAQKWLRKPAKVRVPWNSENRSEQIHHVSMAMAYIHKSCKLAVERLHCHQRQEMKIFTPLTFKEYVHVFKVIAAYIIKQEKAKQERFESALARINEAYATINEYKRKVDELTPQHQMSLGLVKEHVEYVDIHRQEYIEALDNCKAQEERIEQMLEPLEKLRQEAQTEFDKVNPIYHAALTMVQSLEAKNFYEIRSFPKPPAIVIHVMDAICVLFGLPTGWENGRALLMRPNFYKDLEFYDKDNIPDHIFLALADYFYDPELAVERVQNVNMAAAAMCAWVRAVYRYAEIVRHMGPKHSQVQAAEAELKQAQEILGEKRVAANRIKSALEAKIHSHRQAVMAAKVIEKQIQGVERQIDKANHLMTNMAEQHLQWKTGLRKAKNNLHTAPGDALLAAAAVCYHGSLDNGTRAELMQDWLARCELSNFDPNLMLEDDGKMASKSDMLNVAYSIIESVQAENPAGATPCGSEDDTSEAGGNRTSVHQSTLYRHRPSIYDLGMTPKTEVQVAEKFESAVGDDSTTASYGEDLLLVREDFTLQDVLSSWDEYSTWSEEGQPSDVASLHNALILRTAAQVAPHGWPLMIDPDGQAEAWVRAIQNGTHNISEEQLQMSDGDLAAEAETLAGDFDLYEDGCPPSRATTVATEGEDMYTYSRQSSTQTPQTSRTTGDEIHPLSLNLLHSSQPSTVQVNVTEVEEHPTDNLWVIAADAEDIQDKIISALVYGVGVLVTHYERRPLPDLLRPILNKERRLVDDGNFVVTIGSSQLLWHPDFRLYLCASVPMFLKGAGLSRLPVQQMCVVDMATGQEGIIHALLYDIMRMERPEFEAQKHSNEADALQHHQALKEAQNLIFTKILNLGHPLLTETSMLSLLQQCKASTTHSQTILEEAQYLRRQLEEKRINYIPVAVHGAKLYELAIRIGQLHPYYHVTFKTFVGIVRKVLKECHRGKGTQGCPKARAQELMNAITSAAYKFLSGMMFEGHAHLFALLVVMERLRMMGHLTNQELGLFVNGVDSSQIAENILLEGKPRWMSSQAWLDCAALELMLPCFRGLRHSLQTHADEWQEYFKCKVFLHIPLPDEGLSLSIFQKCLLWKFCVPDKLHEVCRDLVLLEMGGVIQPNYACRLQEVYEHSNSATPLTVVLPKNAQDSGDPDTIDGNARSHAVQEVISLGLSHGMASKLHVVTCGTKGQMSEIFDLMRECMKQGYWLILNNVHLVEAWSDDVLNLIKVIVNSGKLTIAELSMTSSFNETEITGQDGDPMHADFRLWLTVQSGGQQDIPGYVIQCGVKVAWEEKHDFCSTAKTTFEHLTAQANKMLAANNKMAKSPNLVTMLSVLYSVLVHRRGYGTAAFSQYNGWSQFDLQTTLQQLLLVSSSSKEADDAQICSYLYGQLCLDPGDRGVVEGLVKHLILNQGQVNQLPDNPTGLLSLMKALTDADCGEFTSRLDKLCDLDARTFDLAPVADEELGHRLSSCLVQDLLHVLGAPELVTPPLDRLYHRATETLTELQATLDSVPEFPTTKQEGFYPMQVFFHSEVTLLKNQIATVQSDAMLLQKMAQGELPVDPMHHDQLLVISSQHVPDSWLTQTFPACKDLKQWAEGLKKRVSLLKEYIEGTEEVACFDLAVFSRPERFVQCVLQTFARKQFKDLYKCQLEVEVQPHATVPSKAPVTGVYVKNLLLHNASWDAANGTLQELSSNQNESCKMPLVWLKPVDPTSFSARSSAKVVRVPKYQCPLYVSSSSKCLADKFRVSHINLPTTKPSALWAEKRVFLTCQSFC